MADYLVIRLPADASQPVAWITVDGQGARKGPVESGSLEAASEAASVTRAVILKRACVK